MPEIKISVESASRRTRFCPVSLKMDLTPDDAREHALYDQNKGVTVPFQVAPNGEAGGCVVHWIVESMAPNQCREFLLTELKNPAGGSTVEIQEKNETLQVKLGNDVLTNYHYGEHVPRPVLYPIIGPYGNRVTRAYPMEIVENDHTDHPHHRSVWTAWGDVNGVDVWSEEEDAGRVDHRTFDSYGGGPVFGWINSSNDWVDSEGKKLMEGDYRYRFFNLPGDVRLIEMELTLRASEGNVRLGDTKEGGICSVRVAAPMEVDRGGRIENSLGGADEPETWGKRAPWCDYSGTLGNDQVGIAIFDHPANLRHPTYWHVRNYGLMTANPFGLSYFCDSQDINGGYTLPVGEELTFRYVVYVHSGDAAEGNVRGRYLDWIYPPETKVEQQ